MANSFVISTAENPVSAFGKNFVIHTWAGSGPDYVHVHYGDDEAWYVLEGTLTFLLGDDRQKHQVGPGSLVLVPAGTPHTYFEEAGPTKYLILLTPRLEALIAELHRTPYKEHAAVMQRYESAILP